MKRFYKQASLQAAGPDRWQVYLDSRPVRTPKGRPLSVASAALAAALAEEWNAQSETIEPASMPLSRLAHSAIDLVADGRDAIGQNLANYARTDLVCYRAASPPELRHRQDALWDPFLDWLRQTHKIQLHISASLTAVAQPEASLSHMHHLVFAHDNDALAALNDFVTITGSLVIGLALSQDFCSPAEAWTAARVDETYQEERWGKDAEAETVASRRFQDLQTAKQFQLLAAPSAPTSTK